MSVRMLRDDKPASTILQKSRSLRWNLPDPQSPSSRKLRVTPSSSSVSISLDSPNVEEDVTLCYAPPLSEYDLTACASGSVSVLDPDLKKIPLAPAFSYKSSLDVLLHQLPDIPDWHEDGQQPPQEQEQEQEQAVEIPVETPQSDYHSCFESPTIVFQEVAALKPEHPAVRPQYGQHWRRSHSLDSTDRGLADLSFPTSPAFGYGLGLASPFSLSSSWAIIPTGAGTDTDIQANATVADTAPYTPSLPPFDLKINFDLWQSSPGLRRDEALAVWRPTGPLATYLDEFAARRQRQQEEDGSKHWDEDDDVRSLEQPFPSSASIWVLDGSPPTSPPEALSLSQSASWPAARAPPRTRTRGQRQDVIDGKAQKQRWTLEEQITIALLAAVDSRRESDVNVRRRSGLTSSAAKGERKSRLGRLLSRIWKCL